MGALFQSTRCSACDEPLSSNHVGPCPKCGDTRRRHDVQLEGIVHAHAFLAWQHIHEYRERHKVLFPLVLVITVASPFLGLVLAGWLGVVVGLVIGLITFLLGLRAVTKVREIRGGHEPWHNSRGARLR
jgi:hypothetical protein